MTKQKGWKKTRKSLYWENKKDNSNITILLTRNKYIPYKVQVQTHKEIVDAYTKTKSEAIKLAKQYMISNSNSVKLYRQKI